MNVIEAVEYMKETGQEVGIDTWKITYKLFRNDIIGAMLHDDIVPCASQVLRMWNINDFILSWEDVKKSAATDLQFIVV